MSVHSHSPFAYPRPRVHMHTRREGFILTCSQRDETKLRTSWEWETFLGRQSTDAERTNLTEPFALVLLFLLFTVTQGGLPGRVSGPSKEMKVNYSALSAEQTRASMNLVTTLPCLWPQFSFCILKITLTLNWVSGKNQSPITAYNFSPQENIC